MTDEATATEEREPGLIEKIMPNPITGRKKRQPSGAAKRKAARQKATTPRGGRPPAKKDLSDGIAALWAIGGAALSYPVIWRTNEAGEQWREAYSPGAGRVMQVQAPLAGRELNKWVKDHDLAYKLLEPILGQQGLSVLMTVFAPPLLVGILERKPEAAPMVMPILGPMLFEIWRENKRQAAKASEMMADLMAEGEDVGDEYEEWLRGMGFSSAPPVPVPEPEPVPVP